MGGISIWQLLIIAVIVVLLFGTKKLGSIGSDLGASIKGFKKAMSDDEDKEKDKPVQDADFTAKTLADKQPGEVKKDEATRIVESGPDTDLVKRVTHRLAKAAARTGFQPIELKSAPIRAVAKPRLRSSTRNPAPSTWSAQRRGTTASRRWRPRASLWKFCRAAPRSTGPFWRLPDGIGFYPHRCAGL